jgi:3'-phosphoadenosine 5'-phosphosulfate sulfotransferase (PAPS reductase)/FAD synthetase
MRSGDEPMSKRKDDYMRGYSEGFKDGRAHAKEARIVCRFSCGAASAVATKLTLAKYDRSRVVITYSNPGSEHQDNERFLADCRRWFDHPITVLKSDKYRDTWDVWERERFIAGVQGAPCTGLLKRAPTYDFQQPGDILVFGYTVEEKDRADSFRRQNFEQPFETPLIEAGLTKADCLAMIQRAGIELPAMYRLGYRNNNCIGCPKGGMGYWNKIRRDFPETFERMAALQRVLGPGSGFLRDHGANKRITLDELAPDRGRHDEEPNVECSLMCHAAENEYAAQ